MKRNRMKNVFILTGGIIVAVTMSFVQETQADQPAGGSDNSYAIVLVGPRIDGTTVLHAINNLGWALTGGSTAWSRKTGPRLIQQPSEFGAAAIDINDHGTMAGDGFDTNGKSRIVRWDNGVPHVLPNVDGIFGGGGAIFGDINDLDQIAGTTILSDSMGILGALWNPDGTTRVLRGLPKHIKATANGVGATGINNNGYLCGLDTLENLLIGRNRAIKWDPDGTVHDLGSLDDRFFSIANDINDNGVVIGRGSDGGAPPAVIWKDGVIQQISPLFIDAGAWRINNRDEVIGWTNNLVQERVFLWSEAKGFRYAEDILPPNSKWIFSVRENAVHFPAFTDINDHGQIVGFAPREEFTSEKAFEMVPVEPELVLGVPVPGVAGKENSFTITGALPGAKITFGYGFVGGGSFVPGCNELDAMTQIEDYKIAGSAIADDTGTATLKIFVPQGIVDKGEILYQAVDLGHCQDSQLVVYTFQ